MACSNMHMLAWNPRCTGCVQVSLAIRMVGSSNTPRCAASLIDSAGHMTTLTTQRTVAQQSRKPQTIGAKSESDPMTYQCWPCRRNVRSSSRTTEGAGSGSATPWARETAACCTFGASCRACVCFGISQLLERCNDFARLQCAVDVEGAEWSR